MSNPRSDFFDDVFDIFSMLVGSNFVSLYDFKTRITRYSEAIVDMLGLPGERIEDGMYDWMEYMHPEDREIYDATMKDMVAMRKHTYDLTYRVKLKTGEYSMFRFVGGMIRDVDSHPSLAGGMMVPIGIIGHTDRVTSMRNLQALLEDVVNYEADVKDLSVLLVGFGRLTRINEVYGYGYGSKFLIEVADLLREVVGDRGDIYRTSGSKFVIVSTETNQSDMIELYDEIRDKFREGVETEGVIHNLNTYGGYMNIVDKDDRSDRTFYDCLLQSYNESKQYRHGELVIYNGNHTGDPKLSGKIVMITAIRASLIEDFHGFYLLYQPVFKDGGTVPIGAEAVLRWKSEKYGVVDSEDFLPEIEQDYAFERLGDWVIKNALHDAKEFVEVYPDFKLFITVTQSQIWAPYFVSNLYELIKSIDLPASSIMIQISKECRMLEMKRIEHFAETLRKGDISIGIDDFGRGNAWLKTFSAIHPDYVRISRELVDNLGKSNDDTTIITGLVNMMHLCGKTVYIKGLDSEEKYKYFKGLPVEGFQGEFFSEPVYYDEVLDYYDSKNADN